MTFEVASRVEGRGDNCQDRVAVIPLGGRLVVIVADGAGGTSGGAEAAQAVVDHLRLAVDAGRELNVRGLRQLLLEISLELENRGQTTAVVLVIDRHQVVGASIGDSGAWLVEPGAWKDLTHGQPRKPLLGGGFAEPFTFASPSVDATLLLATDGVLKYADGEGVRAVLRNEGLSAAQCCQSLIDAARLPNGRLQDDAGVVVVRIRPEARLVRGLREWAKAGGESSDDIDIGLERFLRGIFPSSPLATGTDGVEAITCAQDEDSFVIDGSIWSMTLQRRYPFRARLKLGRDRIEAFEVQLGEGDEAISAESPR